MNKLPKYSLLAAVALTALAIGIPLSSADSEPPCNQYKEADCAPPKQRKYKSFTIPRSAAQKNVAPPSALPRGSSDITDWQADTTEIPAAAASFAPIDASGQVKAPDRSAAIFGVSTVPSLFEEGKNTGNTIRTSEYTSTTSPKSLLNNTSRSGLETAEQLQIKVIGHRSLSGPYIVGANQTISFPSIGHLNIANMSLVDLEQILATKVSEMTGSRSYVTVEILKYRPVFTTGYLMKPGQISWKPGLTVQQAVSLSGGLFRPQTGATAASSPALEKRAQRTLTLQRSIIKMQFILAQLVGLEAERSGARQLKVPQQLTRLVGLHKARELVDFQNDLMHSRQSALQSKINALRLEIETVGLELASLQAQKKFLSKQLAMTLRIWKGIADLKRRKHVGNIRHMQAQKSVAQMKTRKYANMVAIAQVQRHQLELERKIITAKQDRRQKINNLIETLLRKKATQELEISTSRKALAALPTARQGAAKSYIGDSQVVYQITRKIRNISTTSQVDRSTEMQSNDILNVIPVLARQAEKKSGFAQNATN
ncbi:MAG: polysaccharide biosynthesis/export family protein [Hyphomicrobiaceae bacterium]|nr:polysaccharide biosynthesis/export family protein [Hyphomicrobiaceae bacterium]